MPRASLEPRPTPPDLAALPLHERERAQRLRRALGVGLILAVGALIVVARCGIGASRETAALERGLDLLYGGLRGQRACLGAAQQSFARGAGSALVDPYPVFLIEAADRFESGHFTDATATVRAVFEALARLDLDLATTRLTAVPPELAGRHELARLVADLSRRNARAAVEPSLYASLPCGP